jgi:hypothetical protein
MNLAKSSNGAAIDVRHRTDFVESTPYLEHLPAFARQPSTNESPTMTTRDDYIEKMKTQLDDLNDKMTQVEAKADEAKEDARAKYKEEMAKLRHQSKVAGKKLEDMRAAGMDNWEAMMTEMDKLRDAFTHSFHYFKSQV